MDTANTGTVFDSDLDVSSLTPGITPGVLDEVVLDSVFDTISSGEDTMVKIGTALGSSDDTSFVELEDEFVGLNGNRDWLLVKGSFELG